MKIKYEPRDLWIGLYWTKARTTTLDSDLEQYTFYVCLIPCLQIIFTLKRNIPKHKRHINWLILFAACLTDHAQPFPMDTNSIVANVDGYVDATEDGTNWVSIPAIVVRFNTIPDPMAAPPPPPPGEVRAQRGG